MSAKLLLIDDDPSMCELLETELQERSYEVQAVHSSAEGLARFERADFDAVLTDVNMDGMTGLELCQRMVEKREDIPVVLITAFADVQTAIAGIRAGAYDFVTKPIDVQQIALTLERALRHRALRDEVKRLRKAIEGADRLDGLLGQSPAMVRMSDMVSRVADTEATVLVSGESGTGKELVARALHAKSSRRGGPFIAINCAAMPEPLLESELFGHMKGAFTDARATRAGLFVRASGGTLFLDEIAEMPGGMQAKLLRALQERTVRPVGGEQEQPFDSRIVAATNRDLETEVSEKRFREDLFYRINVVRVEVPPLRSRAGDTLLLAQYFLERFAAQSRRAVVGLTTAAASKLLAYPWPGNVRELQNCIERAVALARFERIGPDDLPEKIRDHQTARIPIDTDDPAELLSMGEVETRYIRKVLSAVGGNKTLAAQVLGFDRRTLYRKLERMQGGHN